MTKSYKSQTRLEMEISRGGKDGASLEDLAENCISTILSFTSVKDVCSLVSVCRSWRSAADADLVWEKMITQRFGQNISKGISSLAFPSKKNLYFYLVTQHGTKRIWLDESTGKIGCMMSAKDLSITWGENPSYWEWVRRDDSRFDQVARLRCVWWFHVLQRFNCTILSPNTHYTVSFIIIIDRRDRWNQNIVDRSPFIFSVETADGHRMESARFLDDLEKSVEYHGKGFGMTPFSEDENGWLEFVAGEFFLEEEFPNGGAKEIEFSMKNIDCSFTKRNIWVEGVKIEPKH